MRKDFAQTQLTSAPYGHILANAGVWSPDGEWIVFDVRSDPAGAVFDGRRIERVHTTTREVQVLYEARHDACVGVPTCSPADERVVFIHGPEKPTAGWTYSATHRHGVIVRPGRQGAVENLEARNLGPPFTPGAMRGGTHLHTFDSRGEWVAFTYEDEILAQLDRKEIDHEPNQRNVGVSVPGRRIVVDKSHPRNHDGSHFSVLVTRTVPHPRPGSDEISRAYEEAWVGVDGYRRHDGTQQRRAIAFQGDVVTRAGLTIAEAFIVDLPDDLTQAGDGPIEGTSTRRPCPPRATAQRRLTFTESRPHPGIQGPRHWLRSSPDGSRIAFLMKDDRGLVQLWTVSPNGGEPKQVTHHAFDVSSAFTWHPDGGSLAHVMDNRVFLTNADSGEAIRLTPRCEPEFAPRPEACVFSPNGDRIAYAAPVRDKQGTFNQVFVTRVPTARL